MLSAYTACGYGPPFGRREVKKQREKKKKKKSLTALHASLLGHRRPGRKSSKDTNG